MKHSNASSWSNFWGDLDENGQFEESHDYMKIMRNEIRLVFVRFPEGNIFRKKSTKMLIGFSLPTQNSGLWNVPVIASCYLVKKVIFPKMIYTDDDRDADVDMCKSLRNQVNIEYFSSLLFNHILLKFLTKFKFLFSISII